ncbi:Hypothetical predicted protein, partial [Podarcis lilfordi]
MQLIPQPIWICANSQHFMPERAQDNHRLHSLLPIRVTQAYCQRLFGPFNATRM